MLYARSLLCYFCSVLLLLGHHLTDATYHHEYPPTSLQVLQYVSESSPVPDAQLEALRCRAGVMLDTWDGVCILSVPLKGPPSSAWKFVRLVPIVENATLVVIKNDGRGDAVLDLQLKYPSHLPVPLVEYGSLAFLVVSEGGQELLEEIDTKFPSAYMRVQMNKPPYPCRDPSYSLVSLPGMPEKAENGIAALVAQVSQTELKQFAKSMTSVHSRLSWSATIGEATGYLVGVLEGFGLSPELFSYTVESQPDRTYAPDVIVDIPGVLQPDVMVVIGAHYDDRAKNITNSTARAPGANDDGSGSSMVLELARILSSQNPPLQFRYTLRLCFWSGEEQGLFGSEAYAKHLKENNVNVIAMLQGDMIAYTATTPAVAMANVLTSKNLTTLVNKITELYVPDLPVFSTDSCCTDSASFYDQGYAAVAYNEKGGYVIGDIVDRPGYSIPQLSMITQAVLAAGAILAQAL